jgi:hypothetical protein
MWAVASPRRVETASRDKGMDVMAGKRQRLGRGRCEVRAVCLAALTVAIGVVAAAGSDRVSAVRGATVGVAAGRSAAVACPSWQPRSASWSPARVLSGGGRQFGPARLAVAPSGAAIAAWGPGVTVSLRSAGGAFGRARRLAARAQEQGPGDQGGIQVGFADGRPIVAWTDARRLHVAVASRHGTRFRESHLAVERSTSFSLAWSASRPALLVWSAGTEVFAAELTRRGLGRPDALGFRPNLMDPPLAAAIDPHGGASVAVGGWSAQNASLSLTLLTRAPGRAVVTDQMLLPGYPGSLRIARDRSGATALLWQRMVSPSTGPSVVDRLVIEGAARGPDGDLGRPRTLSTPAANPTDLPGFAADATGNAISVWVEALGGSWQLVAVERRAGRDWGRRRIVLKTQRRPHAPRIALDDRGRAAAAFSATCGAHAALISVRRSRAAAWHDPEIVAAWAGYIPDSHSLGIDSRGVFTELWSRRPRAGGGLRSIPIVVATRSP